jgi:hypothetical protein
VTAQRREISVHVLLRDDADAMLEALALASGKDKSALASDLLHAERLVRSGCVGKGRE